MIDKIKIMADVPNPDFLLDNFKWRYIENEEQPMLKQLQTNLSNKSRMFGLRMLLTENLKTGLYSLSLDGSIKKWYFNENSRKDLNFLEFYDCIELLGKKLGFKKNKIWTTFKITQLEVGVTLLLKHFTNDVLNCFIRYRNAERDIRHETTLYFRFKNYDILFYDKFLEMNDGKKWSKEKEITFKKFLLLRFEISVTKVSGSTFKNKLDTLKLLKDNWNLLPKILEEYFKDVQFVDLISKEKNIKSETMKEYLSELSFFGMKRKGIHKTIMDFNGLKIPNNKDYWFKKLLNNYVSNIDSERDYKAEIMFELKKKTTRLHNKSKIRYMNN